MEFTKTTYRLRRDLRVAVKMAAARLGGRLYLDGRDLSYLSEGQGGSGPTLGPRKNPPQSDFREFATDRRDGSYS